MFRECPHCWMRVWPDEEGTCPSCQKNVFDLRGVDPDKTTLVIRPSSRMPQVCIDCGLATSRLAKVVSYGSRQVAGVRPDDHWLVLGLILGRLFPLSKLVWLGRGDDAGVPGHVSTKMKLRVPQCRMCSANTIEPVYVNHESAIIKLVVHKRFEEEFQALNGS